MTTAPRTPETEIDYDCINEETDGLRLTLDVAITGLTLASATRDSTV